jgi:hypothetical protein
LRAILAAREAEALAAAKAEVARIGEDIEVRALVAQGRSAEAEVMRAQLAAQRELADLQARFPGLITAEVAARLAEVQALEAAAAARVREQESRRADEDLGVRRLVAEGRGPEADARRGELERQREIEDAIAAGRSAQFLAELRAIQELETAAAGLVAAAEAAAAAAALAVQQQQASEDLQVRLLRATGQGGAADDLAFQLAQQRERATAVEGGTFTEAMLALLDQVQAAELARRTAGSASDPFGVNAATPDFGAGATRAQTAVSATVTDRTALLLVDQLRVQTTLLRMIEQNTRAGQSDRAIDEALGRRSQSQNVFTGNVSRS